MFTSCLIECAFAYDLNALASGIYVSSAETVKISATS